MKLAWAVEIAGTGASVPERVVTNDDFARRLDTSDQWIVQRTGIRERRIVGPDQSTLALASTAGRMALANARVPPDQIDLIVCCTITPEHTLPSTSCELQDALGCPARIPAYDLVAACSGFVYGVISAAQHIITGTAQTVLVVGVECLSRITDMEDRSTAVLFGDGAGAAVIRASRDPQRSLLSGCLGADGSRAMYIWVPAGGSKEPASVRTVNERLHFMRMQGREVYKFAVTKMEEIIAQTVAEAGLTVDDLALVVPHQSNLRIIESASRKLGLPLERVVINIDRYGNTSAASVPVALHEAWDGGRIKRGDHVMLVAIGGGLTWATALLRV
jgi:3-oxoacyl-[acyl-carrier-protein] synthase-3